MDDWNLDLPSVTKRLNDDEMRYEISAATKYEGGQGMVLIVKWPINLELYFKQDLAHELKIEQDSVCCYNCL